MSKPIHEMEELKRLNQIKFSQLSFFVFHKNYQDLKKLIDFFCHSKEGFALTNVANRHKLDLFQDELIRFIHNFVASVGSLVDHTRKFYQKNYESQGTFPDYQKKIDEVFLSDELVSFVQDYRNYCLHYSLPNISTGIEFVQGKGTWQFIRVNPDDLLKGFGWKSASKKFIGQFSASFDLPPIFETYFQKVVVFYQWYNERLSEIHKDDAEKVSEAKRAERIKMAPQIMAILRMDLENESFPISIDSLLAGFLSNEKLTELEPTRGTPQWIEGAVQFLVENDIITPEFASEISKKYCAKP